MLVKDDTNILELFLAEKEKGEIDCVLIDECQFLRKHHVEELIEIVDSIQCTRNGIRPQKRF